MENTHMDYRFQPQLAMSYEASLQEASRKNSFTDVVCLGIRGLQFGLDFYEEQAIDTGIVGLLNGIWLTVNGFIVATGSLAITPAAPGAAVGATVGTGLMSFGIVNAQIYFSHIASGGNVFHSRKEMEEYENALYLTGDKTISKTLFNLYERVLLNKLPTRATINMIRENLDRLCEPLDCREPLPERHPYSIGDQDATALKKYARILAKDIWEEFDKLNFSVQNMLDKLNQQKPERPVPPPDQSPGKTPVSPPPVPPAPIRRLSENGPVTREPIFTGDAPNPPDKDGPIVA